MEIWWESPTRWKREVRSPEFHQVEIVDGGRDWQRNEGGYFPQWLRETAVALVKPVPPIDEVLEHVKTAEVRRLMGQINFDWTTASGTADLPNILRNVIALRESTGLLLYCGGFGWGALFHDYQDFHGRMIARTVSVGSPEVTAKVTTLEDLGQPPATLFDTRAQGGDPQPLETVLLDEISLRKNLISMESPTWPALLDGPLQGGVSTTIVVDREGKIREISPIVAVNSGVTEVGKQAVESMRFKPFVVNDRPVQVLAQVTILFKTTRPAGTEPFESAETYFERGRRVSFPATGAGKPYILRAEFEVGKSGDTAKGRYEDTWLSETRWRREAWLGNSRYVRSQNGETTYQFAEGPDAGILRLVLKALEPIPAIDTFTESDWRIKRDTVNGVPTVRVLAGYESPEGTLDPEQARGYWFDASGLLLKSYAKGVEMQRSEFEDFQGVRIAHRIDLLKNGALGMRIRVTDVSPAGPAPAKEFEVRGHEWKRAFTDEVR